MCFVPKRFSQIESFFYIQNFILKHTFHKIVIIKCIIIVKKSVMPHLCFSVPWKGELLMLISFD